MQLSVKDIFSGKEGKYSLVIAVAKLARKYIENALENGEIITEQPVNLAIKELREQKYFIIQNQEA